MFKVVDKGIHTVPKKRNDVHEHALSKKFVRIHKDMRVTFCPACTTFLGETSYVLFLVDEKNKKAAIRPSKREDNAYVVQRPGGRLFVNAARFIQTMGIPGNQRLPATISGGMIQFSYARGKKSLKRRAVT
jgi:hypothetical protein